MKFLLNDNPNKEGDNRMRNQISRRGKEDEEKQKRKLLSKGLIPSNLWETSPRKG